MTDKDDLISREALKEDLFIKFGNQLPNGLFDEIDHAPTVELATNLQLTCNNLQRIKGVNKCIKK